jgi:hypothetical protein
MLPPICSEMIEANERASLRPSCHPKGKTCASTLAPQHLITRLMRIGRLPAPHARLWRSERLPLSIADPCCGSGAILEVLKIAGHIVHGRDIIDYGWLHTVICDYLNEPAETNGVAIVTNPPYRLALKFIEKAFADGAQYSAWLLRLNFLESMRRKPFFEANPPSRLHIFSRRLPMSNRLGWTGKEAPSNMAFSWFVWDRRPESATSANGKDLRPQLNFVDWKVT